MPLLIGGATTSRVHTAVKVAPTFNQAVVHVRDASRAVGVVSKLVDPVARAEYKKENDRVQQKLRNLHEMTTWSNEMGMVLIF